MPPVVIEFVVRLPAHAILFLAVGGFRHMGQSQVLFLGGDEVGGPRPVGVGRKQNDTIEESIWEKSNTHDANHHLESVRSTKSTCGTDETDEIPELCPLLISLSASDGEVLDKTFPSSSGAEFPKLRRRETGVNNTKLTPTLQSFSPCRVFPRHVPLVLGAGCSH